MKISLVCIGKTDDKEVEKMMKTFILRLPVYVKFEVVEIQEVKNAKSLSKEELKNQEYELFDQKLPPSDSLILLDEKGKEMTSMEFAGFLQQKMNQSVKHLIFCVGGYYGFSEKMYQRAHQKLSLSKMTFTHQMVRLFFVEQLYRGFSILENKPYHHE